MEGQTATQAELEAIIGRIASRETDGIEPLTELLGRSAMPLTLSVLGNLAWALACAGRHDEAIEHYRRYIELSPGSHAEVYWRMGDRCINLGRLDEAADHYEAALRAEPGCLDARMGIRYVKYLRTTPRAGHAIDLPRPRKHTQLQDDNARLNSQEFDKGTIRLQSMPPVLHLESTTRCNFYCRTCLKGYGPYHAEDLQPEILALVRDRIMPANTRIAITGFGEPTMAPCFDELLDMALRNGSLVHFVTNASLLNFQRLERLTRASVHIGLSIDGATAATFESIRSGSNFERFVEKLAMIKKLRDINLSNSYSSFAFQFVAQRSNIHELADVVRLAHRFGIMRVNVADYAMGGREWDKESLRFMPDEANRCIEEARAVAAQLGVTLDTPPPYSPLEPAGRPAQRRRLRLLSSGKRPVQRCFSPWREPYIRTDGTVGPCCTTSAVLGDLKSQSFDEIWNGWRYRLLRRLIHSPFPPSYCRNCFVCWGINGGNAANAIAREGLIVRAFYHLSPRVGRLVRGLRGLLHGKGGGAPPPQPNYERGRPIRPASTPPDSR